MVVCKEMQKLRDYLDNKGIEWRDNSDELANAITGIWFICRTRFELNRNIWSVVNGNGTYGGVDIFTGKNAGLLELMTNSVNDGEPVGHLTADEVIKYIENRGKYC